MYQYSLSVSKSIFWKQIQENLNLKIKVNPLFFIKLGLWKTILSFSSFYYVDVYHWNQSFGLLWHKHPTHSQLHTQNIQRKAWQLYYLEAGETVPEYFSPDLKHQTSIPTSVKEEKYLIWSEEYALELNFIHSSVLGPRAMADHWPLVEVSFLRDLLSVQMDPALTR